MIDSQPLLISVITCFYNEVNYLGETIQSVIDQTYNSWELILVDDGSTDGSTEIARSFAQKFPGKIFYYNHSGHQNKGVCASRNLAVSKVSGTWIALLDGDDVWLPEKLSKQAAAISNGTQFSMTCEASEYWQSWNDKEADNMVIEVGSGIEGVFSPPILLSLLYPLGKGDAPCPSSIVIKKETILSVGGFEEQFKGIFQLYEDQAFLCKVYLNEKVHISRSCNNKYRLHQGSCVNEVTNSGKYSEVRSYFLEWFNAYIKEKSPASTEILQLIETAKRSDNISFLNRIRILLRSLWK